MAADLRQVMAAFLTFSMFIMLGNMIKKDHIDPLLEPYPAGSANVYKSLKISKPAGRLLKDVQINEALWARSNQTFKPCWQKPSTSIEEEREASSNNGYIFFSLTHGPEYHASQVANAVAVARHLGAKLAIPDISRGTKVGNKRQLGEMYDVDKFVASLHGLVQVDKNPPPQISKGRLPIVKVPYQPSTDFISSKIEPVFRNKQNVKLVTYYTNSNTTKGEEEDQLSNTYECVATFESLNLNTELQRVVDSMVGTLTSMSDKTRGRFVAVDLKDNKCKSCYDAGEIAEFMSNVGFLNDTTLYLTQTGWTTDLDGLRNRFPNTFTKDAIMGVDHKAKYMGSENHEYEKLIDFYTCVKGDVFIPSMGNRFYSGVVGKRISKGKTRVFIPAKNASIEATSHYLSPFIANKTHFAYSCFC